MPQKFMSCIGTECPLGGGPQYTILPLFYSPITSCCSADSQVTHSTGGINVNFHSFSVLKIDSVKVCGVLTHTMLCVRWGKHILHT